MLIGASSSPHHFAHFVPKKPMKILTADAMEPHVESLVVLFLLSFLAVSLPPEISKNTQGQFLVAVKLERFGPFHFGYLIHEGVQNRNVLGHRLCGSFVNGVLVVVLVCSLLSIFAHEGKQR